MNPREPTAAPRILRTSRAASACALLLAAVTLLCVSTLPWTLTEMRRQDLSRALLPPSTQHPLGTDALGRDLSARMLAGGALSLGIGLAAALVAVLIGSTYGLVAGYAGGWLDELMMRTVDVLYALPSLLLVMLLTFAVAPRLEVLPIWPAPDGWHTLGREWARLIVLTLAIGGVSWLTVARVVRGQVLALRERPFIEAARALGLPPGRILRRHLLPNVAGPVIVFATLAVPQAILQESFLSFLGIGVAPPQATWGSLVADGVRALNPVRWDWWLAVFPAVALSATLLALNILGDALRDAFDVRAEKR